MILFTLIVDSIELHKSSVRAWYLTISQKSPNLSQGHTETFFALRSFHLFSVVVIPILQFTIVTKHYVLDFFFNSRWILLEFDKIRDVNKLFKRILLNFFFSCETSFCLR